MFTHRAILTAAAAAKSTGKMKKVYDADGLHIRINPTSGRKFYYLDYSLNGKRLLMSLKAWYPLIDFKRAREKADDARRLLDKGIDPIAARAATTAAQVNTYDAIKKEFFARQEWSDSTRAAEEGRYKKHIQPQWGNRPIADLQPTDTTALLHLVEGPTAGGNYHVIKKLRNTIKRQQKYAIATQRAERDITSHLSEIFKSPKKVKHYAAFTDEPSVAKLAAAIDVYEGQPTTRHALKFSMLTGARQGEIRRMEWTEIDFADAMWDVPAEHMKMQTPHKVPLSTQSTAVLLDQKLRTGTGKLVFPTSFDSTRPMSENTTNLALRRLGYDRTQMVAHSFRSIFSTMLRELKFDQAWVELQLSHQTGDAVERAYNYADYLDDRRLMMQAWADYLDVLKQGGSRRANNVLQFRRKVSA